ncbi:MAG: hypothetical protein ACRER5_03035 [Pseudomonas sp.]
MPSQIFHRPDLANTIADLATGRNRISGLPPGLFLAAPRRTGKSTFLELDVVPELERRGYLVMYIDLWKNREELPSKLIANLIARHLAAQQGLLARAASSVGLSKISIQGVEFTLDQVGKAPGASLTEALQELRKVSNKKLVLIVDEAQDVLRESNRMDVMFELKAARDALNRAELNLALVMSGSDRDKLIRLVHSNAAPFLGASIEELPHLGREFTNFVAGNVIQARPDLDLDNQRLWEAFEGFTHRPEEFNEAINSATGAMARPDADVHAAVEEAVLAFQQERDEDYSSLYMALNPLQQAVLTWLLSESPRPKMFSQTALAFYAAMVGKDVSPGSARDALNSLREMEPAVIWRSSHGDYALEESSMLDWYQRRIQQGTWPPG